MNEIEIINTLDTIPYNLESIRLFMEGVLDRIGIETWSIGLLITNNEDMRRYNYRWRNIDAATDVLSFAQSEGESIPVMENQLVEAGDIVVSLERVAEQSELLNRPMEEELRRVIIHGMLHLKGMDHPGDDFEGNMLTLQEKLVSGTRHLAVSS